MRNLLKLFRRKPKPRYLLTLKIDGLTYYCSDLESIAAQVEFNGGVLTFPSFKLSGNLEFIISRA